MTLVPAGRPRVAEEVLVEVSAPAPADAGRIRGDEAAVRGVGLILGQESDEEPRQLAVG